MRVNEIRNSLTLKIYQVYSEFKEKKVKEYVAAGLTNIIAGSSLILVCLPLALRRVKINDFGGVQLAKSFESEETWYDLNQYGARITIKWASITIGSGLAAFVVRFEDSLLISILWVMLPVSITTFIPIIKTMRYAKRL